MGRGRKEVPLGRADIERAMRHTKSNKGAARYLGVSLDKYRTCAKRYTNEEGKTLYEAHKNKSGKGIPKLSLRNYKEPFLMDILEGRVSSQFFSLRRIKERLIEEGFLENCCNRCQYKEARVLDEKVPLILSFLNGNKKDWRLENLEFLCYNCYFINIGDIFEKKQLEALEMNTALEAKKITQFDIPKQHEDFIDKHMDMNNTHIGEMKDVSEYDRPEDYGDDLISFSGFKK